MRPIKAVDAIPPQARREYHRSLLSWLPDGAEAAELRGDQVAQRVMLAYRRHYHRPSDEAWREFLAACEEYRRG
jgi:hypothetical protein